MTTNIKQSVTKLVPLLERLSLVRINSEALNRVMRTIEFAKQIDEIGDEKLMNIKPMISPTDDLNKCVYMRNDDDLDQIETIDRDEIMKNSQRLFEDYYVTPAKHKHYSDL